MNKDLPRQFRTKENMKRELDDSHGADFAPRIRVAITPFPQAVPLLFKFCALQFDTSNAKRGICHFVQALSFPLSLLPAFHTSVLVGGPCPGYKLQSRHVKWRDV